MRELLMLGTIIAVAFCLGYVLYQNGFLVINAKSAQLYMESPRLGKKKNCLQAKFSACNGVIKRVIRLPQGEKYRFAFSTNLTRGRVCIEIYGSKKEGIVTLSPEQPSALVSMGTRATYSVAVKFTKATGEYKLVWDAVSHPPETPIL